MIHLRMLGVALVLAAAASDMAAAADRKACLTPEQRRAAIAAHKAVPLTRAVRTVKTRIGGEVVNARLCEREKGLVYVLTVLARDGKVTQAMVDAADGHWLDGS
jgi:uncharacterized membrane protein YkoI